MTTFFIENKIFIVGVLLLAGMIAGASKLQKYADEHPFADVVQQTSTTTPTAPPVPTISPAAAPQVSTVVDSTEPAAAPLPTTTAPKPSITGRHGDDEYDDD